MGTHLIARVTRNTAVKTKLFNSVALKGLHFFWLPILASLPSLKQEGAKACNLCLHWKFLLITVTTFTTKTPSA